MKKGTAFQSASFLVAFALILSSALPVSAQDRKKPRLILQITVDQLRGDLPHRYYSEFGEGGFRCLYGNGVVWLQAKAVPQRRFSFPLLVTNWRYPTPGDRKSLPFR